jgi:exopolyphosphatase/guanosine-5'-triphosphate,3'-diphosphate pyrophosphatase
VRVGIVDVGANTVRALVASFDDGALLPVREERLQVGFGDEIEETSRVSEEKVEQAAAAARAHVRQARRLGCVAIEVLVTSPGRQAGNASHLVSRLTAAAGVPTRVLSAEEESELAWHGALAAAPSLPETVAVCDVGGGSAQIAVGSRSDRPSWVRSVDIGSLRLTRRAFRDDPPDADDLARAEKIVAREFAETLPPLPLAAIAVGGTARALQRVVGPRLDEEALALAVRRLAKRSRRTIAKDYGIDPARARTMTAGALILREVQRRLGVPLDVGRAGLREGAALVLLERSGAAHRSA